MVSAWQQKAVKDSVKALLPFQTALRRIKRSFFPYATNPDNDDGLFKDVLQQIRLLREYGAGVAGKTVVEIGTGWFPVLPVLYRVCGAAKVITLDQEELLDRHTVADAIYFVLKRNDLIVASGLSPDWTMLEGWESASNYRSLLSRANISYLAPSGFRAVPDDSADVIVSRDVLEHIPQSILAGIFAQSRRILRPNGVLCHTIDMSDHWEHADKSISRVNFLQYEGAWWNLAGFNPQNFQNRLRRSEYMSMLKESGFDVLYASGAPDLRALAALGQLKLCRRYAGFDPNDLATLQSTVVARSAANH